MNKMILICTTLLFSAGAFADDQNDHEGCDNASLKGSYSYEVTGVNAFYAPPAGHEQAVNGPLVTRSTHVIGQVSFDGRGHARFYGIGSAAGFVEQKYGEGEYEVSNRCIAKGELSFDHFHTSRFTIILDTIDRQQRHDLASHGVVLATDTTRTDPPSSTSGSIFRVISQKPHQH